MVAAGVGHVQDAVRRRRCRVQQAWAVGEEGTIVATINGGDAWDDQTSTTTQHLNAVTFVDASRGWAVGHAGVILTTGNGGATWTSQASGISTELTDVAFAADGLHGWTVGAGGVILATMDGGSHWAPQSAGSGFAWRLTGVDAVDATHAWAVAEWGKIVATSNGGANWSLQASGTDRDLAAVAFADATHGWVCGQFGTMLVTSSGGVTPIPPAPKAPAITKLSPTAGKRGAVVTIVGKHFGAKRVSGSSVRFGTKACTKYVSWSDTRIRCKVPAKAAFGSVKVTVRTAAGKSNAKTFRVKR